MSFVCSTSSTLLMYTNYVHTYRTASCALYAKMAQDRRQMHCEKKPASEKSIKGEHKGKKEAIKKFIQRFVSSTKVSTALFAFFHTSIPRNAEYIGLVCAIFNLISTCLKSYSKCTGIQRNRRNFQQLFFI